jgi:hypothetical protein
MIAYSTTVTPLCLLFFDTKWSSFRPKIRFISSCLSRLKQTVDTAH